MNGLKGGFGQALEAGISGVANAVKQQVMPQQNPIAGKQVNSLEDIANLETNQKTSQPYGPPPASARSYGEAMPAESIGNTLEEQAKIATARKALQELEQEMRKIREERERKWADQNKQEEQQKKQLEFMEEQKKKDDPVAQMLKVRKHEGGKATG